MPCVKAGGALYNREPFVQSARKSESEFELSSIAEDLGLRYCC